MDLHAARRLTEAFGAHAARLAGTAPVTAALCRALAEGPAAQDLFSRFYRITSLERPDIPLLIAALHYLSLSGDQAALDPARAAERLEAERETVLDYMLSVELQPHLVERSAAMVAGVSAAVRLFGGGVWLVDAGCAGGLNLFPDRYAYRFGDLHLGDSPLVIPVESRGRTPDLILPTVVGRTGLDLQPRDLRDSTDRLAVASFLLPDATDQKARFHQAADLLAGAGPGPDLRQGAAESDLAPLLFEAYTAMPPGNTLLLTQAYLWPYLSDPQRQQMTWGVQRLAASLQPHKPLAWLQLEPAATGGTAELKLQTFGWTDQEDRTVRRLAEADPALRWINWLE